MKALKYSHQRESIKACLVDRCDHPMADTPYASIHEEFPNISLETVYRNLNPLARTGEIRKLTCGDGTIHFDGDARQHYHFVCSEYDQVYDMELGAMENPNRGTQEYTPGIIDNHYVLFYRQYGSRLQKRVDKATDKPA